MREIRSITQVEKKQLRGILEALPDWFGIPEAVDEYVENSQELPVLGCVEDGSVLGFLTMKETSRETLEIYVMGVLPDHHREGIAKGMMEKLLAYAKANQYVYLQVKTLSPEVQDPYYLISYDFYKTMGFSDVEVLPLWDEWNPCLLMIRKVDMPLQGMFQWYNKNR